jgi:predicted DNA-binding ribbon-helix-helix protein
MTPPYSQEDKADTSLVAGNIKIHKRRTSVRLEPAMWTALYEIADTERISIHDICSAVDDGKAAGESFSSALRVFMLKYYRNEARGAQKQKPVPAKRVNKRGRVKSRRQGKWG